MFTQTLDRTDDPTQATPDDSADVGTRTWLRERVDGTWALAVGVSWFVLSQIAGALEPETSQEEPVIGAVIAVVMWSLIATMATGLAMQRRWGFGAALAAGGFLTAAVIACPTTGHHPFGAWWLGELVCAAAIVGISAYALQRAPTAEPEATSVEHADAG